jgi:Metallo-peptidase family M12
LCTPEGTEADVFVGYTAAAERFTADVEGLILLFTQVAQDVFQGSQTNANVRLAGTERWPYTETGSLRADLAALTALPEARLARDRASADVVLMLVAGGDACGLASAIRATPSNAFAVVALQPTCPASRMSFTHEIGHLYGNRHDLGADPTVSPFRDGHGFAHVSARDVMATDFACNGCPRRKFFSNPNISVDNRPLGDPTCCNNARVIREETGATVPRFKCRNP